MGLLDVLVHNPKDLLTVTTITSQFTNALLKKEVKNKTLVSQLFELMMKILVIP